MSRSSGRRGGPPEAPEPLRVPVADDHCHLDIAHGDGPDVPDGALPLAEALDRAAAAGIDRVVTVGTDVASSRLCAATAAGDPGVLAAVALHPNEVPDLAARGELDAALTEIDALAAAGGRVRAVGETGLDRFRTDWSDGAAARAQRDSLAAHVAIAKRHGLALQIHDRDAHDDVLAVLDEVGAPERTVMHCFSGDVAFARACVERGFTLSFAGTLTFANAGGLRAAAAATPLDRLQVETDAPFLTPVPHRGRPNASYLVPLTVRTLAEVTRTDVNELCTALSATAERLYGPW